MRDTSREAAMSEFSYTVTADPSYQSQMAAQSASLATLTTDSSYIASVSLYEASRSSERNDPAKLSSEASYRAIQDALESSSLGPHTRTQIFMPGAEDGGYISAIGSGGSNAETTTYVVARVYADMGPYGYWVDIFNDVLTDCGRPHACGGVTKPYATMTVGPTTVEWEITYGGMAVSDVAGGLKEQPSWIQTETFTGSCSYTSIPAVSPPDFPLEPVMKVQDVYALPDDNFPTRTAVCTADQEIWLKYGVFPTGTGKPFGQSTYTMVEKGYKKWDEKTLLEDYTPWYPEEIAKTTKGAKRSAFESSESSSFTAHGFDVYGSLGNHYATRLFLPNVTSGAWVSSTTMYGTTQYWIGPPGYNPETRKGKEVVYHTSEPSGKVMMSGSMTCTLVASQVAKSAGCAESRGAYGELSGDAKPSREALCRNDTMNNGQRFLISEGEELDAMFPLVTLVRVHETDIPADACVTRTSKQTKASFTSTAAQTGSGIRPSGPISTVEVGGNEDAQATAALTGAAGVKEVTVWVQVIVGVVAMAAVVV